MLKQIYQKIKSIFVKKETFPCIIWDGKKMSYLNLSKEQIENIEKDPKCSDWIVTIDKERRNY
jgi:hypothetical protein